MDVSPVVLRSFIVLAGQLHFGRAAELLGISSPSLSNQIAKLEQHMGTDLFERTSRQVRLTDAGASFLPLARETVAAHDELRSWRSGNEAKAPHLRVGLGPGGTGPYNEPIFAALLEAIPDLRLEARQVDLMNMGKELRDRSIDVLLGPGLPHVQPPDIHVIAAVQEPRVLVVPSAHRLAKRSSVALEETNSETYLRIGGEDGDMFLKQWLIDPRPDGTELAWGPRAHDFSAVLELCAAGLGVNISGASAERQFPWAAVAYVPIHDLPPSDLLVSVLRGRRSTTLDLVLTVIRRVMVDNVLAE